MGAIVWAGAGWTTTVVGVAVATITGCCTNGVGVGGAGVWVGAGVKVG